MNDNNTRSRSWCLTHNNYTTEDVEYYKQHFKTFGYGVIGHEKGERGTPHLQMYFYLKHARNFMSIKKMFSYAHIEKAKGTPKQASDYCKKDGEYVEYGELPQEQGKRNDLIEYRNQIMDGEQVDNIIISNPMVYHQYGRTLNRLEELRMRNVYRTEQTEGLWIYGPTGSGKSKKAFEGFNPRTHYVWKYDNGWNDGYTQQEIVIIDEFRGQIPFSELLRMIDIQPNYYVRRRGKEPIPFTSKKVIITSSLPPDEVYRNLSQNDSLEQLFRRIKIIFLA